MPQVISLQSVHVAEVARAAEHVLTLAKSGEIRGIYLSYLSQDEVLYDCVYASSHRSAIMLLGQSQMMRVDLIGLTRALRERGT